jgi:hypothetical protein
MIDPLNLDPRAHALRPVRMLIRKNAFRFYTALTFPGDPYGGCWLYLRRASIAGGLVDDGSGLSMDVLDANSDIVQEYPLTHKAFAYLRSRLRFRVEYE